MGLFQVFSFTKIFISIALGFAFHSVWTIYKLSIPPSCPSPQYCLKSSLLRNPDLVVVLFTSVKENPYYRDVENVLTKPLSNFNKPIEEKIKLKLPYQTRNNGSLYLHMFVITKQLNKAYDWNSLSANSNEDNLKVYRKVPLTRFTTPPDKTFNLLMEGSDATSRSLKKPVSHLKTMVEFNILTDVTEFPRLEIPYELYHYFRIISKNEFLPIITYNQFHDRRTYLEEIKQDSEEQEITFKFGPVSFGKLRLLLQVENSFRTISQMGFTEKEIDDVKSIFADTHLYIFLVTMLVSFVHLLFDFLAFKNDVSYWRSKRNTVGISTRGLLWRAFSQTIVFLYLYEEKTSYLVLVPSGISTLIEIWKVLKIYKFEISSLKFVKKTESAHEKRTSTYDMEAMKYLAYVLYPLCVGLAVYSFVYVEHKSVYSWVLASAVKGVYAFGFIFMLPQLFINYKLKSVAHLPWRTFMYKAFNTFIDDVFAFLITMPTMHRLACFRDDIVFLIYLYQRWLYPVDKSRVDDSSDMTEETENTTKPTVKEKKKFK